MPRRQPNRDWRNSVFPETLIRLLYMVIQTLFSWETVAIFDLKPRVSIYFQCPCDDCLTLHYEDEWEIVVAFLAENDPRVTPLCSNSIFEKCLADLQPAFQIDLTNSFREKWQTLSIVAIFGKWILGQNIIISNSQHPAVFTGGFSVLLSVDEPKASSVTFFDVEKTLLFDQKRWKLFSLIVRVLPNWATLEIYPYEKFLQIQLWKVLFRDFAEFFNLRQVAVWLYTCRRIGNFLRILNKVILKDPRFVQNSFFQKCLADLHASFWADPSITSGRSYRFCQKFPFSKNEL